MLPLLIKYAFFWVGPSSLNFFSFTTKHKDNDSWNGSKLCNKNSGGWLHLHGSHINNNDQYNTNNEIWI